MDNEQLIADLLDKAERFNTSGTPATEDTVISDVLKSDHGPEGAKAPAVFESVIKWDIDNNGAEVKQWPTDWMSLTFKQLAGSLLIFLMVLLTSFKSEAQLAVNLSAVKTALKDGGLQMGISYIKSLDGSIGGKSKFRYGKHSVFVYTPDFNIQAGTADAMSSITAKVTAMSVSFKTKNLKGLNVADLNKTFTVIPLSLGVETNGVFGFINGLAEAGYAPWWGGKIGKYITTAAYMQGGYKFKIDTVQGVGGAADESAEPVNDALLRLKGHFAADSRALVTIDGIRVGVAGKATVWFDLLNDETYYKLDGILRFYIFGNNTFDVAVQRGSGAPNFNTGTQYSGGLTIRF